MNENNKYRMVITCRQKKERDFKERYGRFQYTLYILNRQVKWVGPLVFAVICCFMYCIKHVMLLIQFCIICYFITYNYHNELTLKLCNEKLYSHLRVNYTFKMLMNMSEILYKSQIMELKLERKM